MQNATLMSRVDTDLVTREQLAQIETPESNPFLQARPPYRAHRHSRACTQAEPHHHSERTVRIAPGGTNPLRGPAASVSRYGGRHGGFGPAHF